MKVTFGAVAGLSLSVVGLICATVLAGLGVITGGEWTAVAGLLVGGAAGGGAAAAMRSSRGPKP